MIRKRVVAGLARGRAEGEKLGRPTVGPKKQDAIRARLTAGDGMVKVAKALGVEVSAVQRVKAEMPAAPVDDGAELMPCLPGAAPNRRIRPTAAGG